MEMEAESPRTGRRSKPASRSSSIGSGGSGGSGSGSGSVEYTSLRDMLVDGGGGGGCEHHHHHGHGGGGHRAGSWREFPCNNNDNIHEFDASNIGIRNHLLKHAASAYLQSAVVVSGARDQSCCLGRLWSHVLQLRCGGGGGGNRGRGRVLMRVACSWQGCVDDPAELCAAFVARSARCIAAFFVGIWT